MILLLGFVDDCYPLSVKIRFTLQIIIASLLVWITDLKFASFGHSFGLSNQIDLGLFSFPITVVGVVFVTNAFNLMDGADGIAGSLALMTICGIWLYQIFSNGYDLNLFSVALVGGLIPFLFLILQNRLMLKFFSAIAEACF